VLSAALAGSAVRSGLSCLLVDGDPLGPGLDLLLGAEDAPGMRWPDLALARGSLVTGTLGQGLPLIDGIRVLAWDRAPAAVPLLPETLPTVLEAGLAEHDLVVLDLPRSAVPLGAIAEFVDLGLLVVPAEVRAASAAVKVAAQRYSGVRTTGLVVRGPAPTGLTASAIASVLRLPIIAEVRPEPGLAAALDRGEPPGLRRRGPLAKACRVILAEVADLHAR
jgi:secretion/DNA translocation related CpaE-like protein